MGEEQEMRLRREDSEQEKMSQVGDSSQNAGI